MTEYYQRIMSLLQSFIDKNRGPVNETILRHVLGP